MTETKQQILALFLLDQLIMYSCQLLQLLAVAGPPYDTLEEVIGIRGSANVGSLKDFGVTYREVPVSHFLPWQPPTVPLTQFQIVLLMDLLMGIQL
jgi:hypothetical protein